MAGQLGVRVEWEVQPQGFTTGILRAFYALLRAFYVILRVFTCFFTRFLRAFYALFFSDRFFMENNPFSPFLGKLL